MGFAREVTSRVIFIDVGSRVLGDRSKYDFFCKPGEASPAPRLFDKLFQH